MWSSQILCFFSRIAKLVILRHQRVVYRLFPFRLYSNPVKCGYKYAKVNIKDCQDIIFMQLIQRHEHAQFVYIKL